MQSALRPKDSLGPLMSAPRRGSGPAAAGQGEGLDCLTTRLAARGSSGWALKRRNWTRVQSGGPEAEGAIGRQHMFRKCISRLRQCQSRRQGDVAFLPTRPIKGRKGPDFLTFPAFRGLLAFCVRLPTHVVVSGSGWLFKVGKGRIRSVAGNHARIEPRCFQRMHGMAPNPKRMFLLRRSHALFLPQNGWLPWIAVYSARKRLPEFRVLKSL
jgi:hypothetical protein